MPSQPRQSDSFDVTCSGCGRPLLTEGQVRRQAATEERHTDLCNELDSTYAHIRALVAQAEALNGKGMKHALIGLLPEVSDMDDDFKARLREKGMGHLVEDHEAAVAENWRELMGDSDA